MAKQTTGALQFMVAFALRRGGLQHLREYVSLLCALGGGRSVPAKISTPLTYTIISNINQGGVFENPDGLQGGTVRTGCQDRVRSINVQVVQRSPEHRLYQSTTQVLLRTRPPSTLLLCHNTTHQTVREFPSIEHSIHPRTQMLRSFTGRGKGASSKINMTCRAGLPGRTVRTG